MTRFHEKYKDRGLQVIAVNAEDKEIRGIVADFAAKLKLRHRIFLGGSRAADRYEFEKVLPTSFWIDRGGKVLRRESGFRPEMEKAIERWIQELLAAPGADSGPPQSPGKKPETP